MKRRGQLAIGSIFLASVALLQVAHADFELNAPDGRRILLKDDGTWSYAEEKDSSKEKDPPKEKPKPTEAILRLEWKVEGTSSCRYGAVLVNNHPYQIRNFVPQFSAYRANGVIYD